MSGVKEFWWVLGGHGKAYFSGVGRYSLIKTYAMSDKSNKRLTDLKRKKLTSTSDLGAPLLG